MDISQSSLFVFHLLSVVCPILSGLFIFALRGNRRTTNYMSLAHLTTGVLLVVYIIQHYNTPYYMHTLWEPVFLLTILLVYPLFFAYIFALMHPNPIGLCFWLVSYVPLCVLILLGSVFYFTGQPLPSITDYDQLDEFLTNPLLWCYFAAIILWLVEVVVFVCKGLQMQQQHSINLLSDFSYTEGAGLGWVRWMIGIMVIVSIVSLLAILFEGRLFKIIALLTVSMESIFTTIFVLRQRDLYQYTAKKESESGGFFKTVIHIGCYNGERASMEDFSIQKHELLKQNLLQLLEIDEIFKDSELSSEKMREMLGTNRTYLWQVINRDLGTNFYNLVNSYRLKKAEELMTNPSNENISLKNVAEICGFKSLSAFSNLFHKTYGVRAKDWRKNINSQQVENSIDDYR